VIDSTRLKQPENADRLAELREIIRDIRSDEANVYRELRSICAMCQDYDGESDAWRDFYMKTQAKIVYAVTSHTPAEILLPLRRFLDLCRHRRFARSLFPREARIDRGIEMLRVHDAIGQGASQREIGAALFGDERVARDWVGESDSLRSRVRRLVREAHAMARGGYRQLMRRRP